MTRPHMALIHRAVKDRAVKDRGLTGDQYRSALARIGDFPSSRDLDRAGVTR